MRTPGDRSVTRLGLLLLVVVLIVVATVFACSGPRFVHYPAPKLTPLPDDMEALIDQQCAPRHETDDNRCDLESPLGRPIEEGGMQCDEVLLPPSNLGGLEPRYPLLLCYGHSYRYRHSDWEWVQVHYGADDYLHDGGRCIPVYVRYVVLEADGLRLVRNIVDMQAIWAPVQSQEEALSYALAATGYEALYGERRRLNVEYAADVIEDTHVVETGTGYEVLLYRRGGDGYDSRWVVAVRVRVGYDGSISQMQLGPVYRYRLPNCEFWE